MEKKNPKLRKFPVGPYPSSRIGRCYCVYDGINGLALRILPNLAAAARWKAKHFGGTDRLLGTEVCRSKVQVLSVFDRQMKLGLTSLREIEDLLWYGGVASDWKGHKAKADAAA